ncbi:unnamed protein product [Phytophthora fragariaefolia]|uniref:Unnamed protein product n=1 Tax=Phytophthora fragariaefolia TaxID=1490495 RepID=A0A9W6YI42_9STRA|nr:unnamed protein product [Phytophthora fragariaefolia]
MSTPTTQAAGTPAASAAGNIVVATSATTGSSLASTSVVTPTVTTPSSPKRTMSLGDYKKARGNTVFARDELEALFDADSDADMEDGEEDEETLSSRRDDPSVGSRHSRENDSGCDSTPFGVETSRTGAVRDPWMRTPSEIESRLGSTAPPSPYALFSCSGIKDDDVTKELDFDPATYQRRDYYIGLFHELRWYKDKKPSRSSRPPEWQALCQRLGAFVDNFNSNPIGYRERVRLAHERYERFSKHLKLERLHWGAVETSISYAVPIGIACEHCHVGAVRVSERDINGYTGVRAPEELKPLHTNLIAQMDLSAAGGREDAAGLVRQTPLIHWRLLNASKRPSLPRCDRSRSC